MSERYGPMLEDTRGEQIRSDTLATLDIASEMVRALTANLQSTIDRQDDEIRRLRRHIAKIEARLSTCACSSKLPLAS